MLFVGACLAVISTASAILSQYSHNVAFDGPFNDRHNEIARRLLSNDSYPTDGISFYHGVASGEPTATDLLIWTRVTPPFQDEFSMDRNETFNQTQLDNLKSLYHTLSIQWAIGDSADFIDFDCTDSSCGSTLTSSNVDYTVKVIVDGLSPDSWYYYQFKVGNTTSDIGRTHTIPSNDTEVSSWRFAFSSCKQYAHGFFNNLGDIAGRDDLDMMVWLGDYIYEFPNDALINGTDIGRVPIPNNYLYNLSHYRMRYLSHHLDDDVKAAHQALPWYIVWDDHEVLNDYWKTGGPEQWQDDDLYGVDFEQRRLNAYQAFFEWTPTRSLDVDSRGGLYRSFRIGNLFDLIMIDSRSQRTEPAENMTLAASLSADEHYAMGQPQREWFLNKLNESQSTGVKWRILGSNDVFGQSPPEEVFNGDLLFGEDKWEGFPAERQLIIDHIIENGINNVISLAGGPHMGIAQKVYSTGKPIWNNSSSFPVFTEFTLDALSAPKLFEEDTKVPYIDAYEEQWSWVSPYFRLLVDGYSIMDLNKERVRVEFWINNNTKRADTVSELDIALCIYDGIVDFAECPTVTTTSPGGKEDDKMPKAVLYLIILFAIMVLCCIALFAYCFVAKGGIKGHKNPKKDIDSVKATHVNQASPMSLDKLVPDEESGEDTRL